MPRTLVFLAFSAYLVGCDSAPVRCDSSRDCSSAGLVCDFDEGNCVECVVAADCLVEGQVCRANTCTTVATCVSSRECPGQVCDRDRGYCVDCIANVDCTDGQICEAGFCVDPPTSCASDRECTAMAQVCDIGRGICVDCVRDADCPPSEMCRASTCVPGVRSDGGSSFDAGAVAHDAGPQDGGPPFVPDAACVAIPLETTILSAPPDLLLTVDISGSMCTPLPSSTPALGTKLGVMQSVLTHFVDAEDTRINFGLMLFPADDACGAGTVLNGIAPLNGAPISTTLAVLQGEVFNCALVHRGATPTHLTVDAARAYFASITPNPRGRYMILATDGLPNCGAELPDGTTGETLEETITALDALRIAGVDTYVLGVGLAGADADLRRMAEAGGTIDPFLVMSEGALYTALEMITAEIAGPSCTVELDGPPRDPELLRVRFDGGALIPRDPSHASGWDMDPSTHTITFYGAECTRVQSGDVVRVDYGCPGPLS